MKTIRSMTGYARISSEVPDGSGSWTLTLKSVNHRFLDLQMRLPSNMDALEMQLRRVVKESVARGHIDVTLSYEASSPAELPGYDKDMVARYLAAFRDAQQEHALKQEPDLNTILRLPGVFKAAAGGDRREQALQALHAVVLERFAEALDALTAMRETEGAALMAVLLEALGRIERDVASAAGLRAGVQAAHFNRLQKRMTALLCGSQQGTVGDDRLLQEAAMLAERSDVEEELARLRVHVQHFRSLLHEGGETGKKLDFLLQEMNREANTLLSKSGGMGEDGSRLTLLGLAMKSEIEKAREQVQNLE